MHSINYMHFMKIMMLTLALALIASLAAAGQSLNETDQKQKPVEINTTVQSGQSQILDSNLRERKPEVTLTNIAPLFEDDRGSTFGTFFDEFEYVIFPPYGMKPPQVMTVFWYYPKETNKILNKSLPQYWEYKNQPCSFQINIPKRIDGFIGQIVAKLKTSGDDGERFYDIEGPNIYFFYKRTIERPKEMGSSYAFVLDILSKDKYKICPVCDFGDGKGYIDFGGNCDSNKVGEMDNKRWQIPKGKPIDCTVSVSPMT